MKTTEMGKEEKAWSLSPTRRDLKETWRDPQFEFHRETTWYWVAYREDDTKLKLCVTQNTVISPWTDSAGIRYDIAVPGSYTVFAEVVRENATETGTDRLLDRWSDTIEGVRTHGELERKAISCTLAELAQRSRNVEAGR